MAYILSQKMKGGLLRLKCFFFIRVTFFSVNHRFLYLYRSWKSQRRWRSTERLWKGRFNRTDSSHCLLCPLNQRQNLFLQRSGVIFFCWTRVLSIIGVYLQVNWRKLTVSLPWLQAKPFKFTANFKLYRCWKNPRSWRSHRMTLKRMLHQDR